MKDTFANYDLGMKPEKQKLSNFIVTCSLLKKKKIFSANKINLISIFIIWLVKTYLHFFERLGNSKCRSKYKLTRGPTEFF